LVLAVRESTVFWASEPSGTKNRFVCSRFILAQFVTKSFKVCNEKMRMDVSGKT
jgi:hypothetical protein